MAKRAKKISIRLEVDENGTAKLVKFACNTERSMRRAARAAKPLDNALTLIDRKAGRLISRSLSLGGALGGLGFLYLAKQSLAAADAIGKVADKVGMTTDELQEMRFAAEQSGLSVRTADMAFQRFSRRIAEVSMGTGELLKTAQQYDVQLHNSDGTLRANTAIMGDFAEVIKNASSEQEALRIAFKLFDSEGAAMVNLLRQGKAGMESLRKEARDLGLVLDEDVVRNSERANDEVNKLTKVLGIQFTGAIAELAPEIAKMAGELTNAFKDQDIKENIKGLGSALTDMAGNVGPVVRGISDIGGGLADIIDGWNTLPDWIKGIGLAGAFMAGKKGGLVLTGVLYLLGSIKKSIDSYGAVSQDKASFWEWFTADDDKAEELIKRLNVSGQVGTAALRGMRAELELLDAGMFGAAGMEAPRKAPAMPGGPKDKTGAKLEQAYAQYLQAYTKLTQGEVAARIQAEEQKMATLRAALAKGKGLAESQRAKLLFIEQVSQAKILMLHSRADDKTRAMWSASEWEYLKIQKALYGKSQKLAKAGLVASQKRTKAQQDAAIELARLTGDTTTLQILEVERYTDEWIARGIERTTAEKLAMAKWEAMNKGTLERTLDKWTDTNFLIEEGVKHAFNRIQDRVYQFLTDGKMALEDFKDLFVDIFKRMASQAVAELMASGLVALLKDIVSAFKGDGSFSNLSGLFGSSSKGDKQGSAASSLSSLSSMPSPSTLSSLFGGQGLSSFGSYGGLGSSLFTWESIPTAGLVGPSAPTAAGLSGMGMGAAAAAGALTGGLTSSLLYEGEGYSGIGGTLGGAGGGMAGAAIGTMILPGVGTVIGALLGGALGGAGGGGIASMFGQDDTAEREANAAKFAELAAEIIKGEGDYETYIKAITEAHLSDNRVGIPAMTRLYANFMTRKNHEWWVPTPGQAGSGEMHGMDEEAMRRYQLYGGDVKDADGALGLKELLGEAGDWEPIRDALAALSDESAGELGGALASIRLAAMDWGLSLQDLLPNISEADFASGAWKDKITGLTAATLIQNAADAERAKGLSELEVVQNSVMRSISMLTGFNDMDKENRSSLIDLLIQDTARRQELLDASARLKEVEEQLLGAHDLGKPKVEALAKEYATLNEKLGLNQSVAGKAASAADKFAKVMTESVIPAIEKALKLGGHGSNNDEYHTGGKITMHDGGSILQAALARGMITAHGGMFLGKPLLPGEIDIRAKLGEYVIQDRAVSKYGVGLFDALNNMALPTFGANGVDAPASMDTFNPFWSQPPAQAGPGPGNPPVAGDTIISVQGPLIGQVVLTSGGRQGAEELAEQLLPIMRRKIKHGEPGLESTAGAAS